MKKAAVAALCDHTLLKAFAEEGQIATLCEEARLHHFASVCVNPCYVEQCAALLAGSGVAVCTVIGFPLGANTPAVKAAETKDAIGKGATEVDMVINIGALKSGREDVVYEDIRAVVEAADGVLCKVILETCYLTDAEKVLACQLAERAGAQFVKTSTGFGTGGATVADVALMKKTVGDRMKVKASGGIRTYEEAMAMVAAGADRLGVSASIAISEGAED